MSHIQTYTGKWIDPPNPKPEQICIEDIARSLSFKCRFNGHCLRFYSVADHSIRVAWALPDELSSWGLLHDAAEAYLSDLWRPVKRLLPKYRKIEHGFMKVIAQRFDLCWPVPREVCLVDDRMLMREKIDLLNPTTHPWVDKADPLPGKIVPMTMEESEEAFLKMAELIL